VSGDGGSLIKPKWRRSRKRWKRRASVRRIWSEMPQKFSPTAGLQMRHRRSRSRAAGARYQLGGMAGSRVSPEMAPASPYYLRAPDASRKGPTAAGVAAGIMITLLSGLSEWGAAALLWSNQRASATRRASRSCMAPRFTAAGAKAIRDHADRAQHAGAPAETGRKVIGFAVSRMAATRPKYCRSRSTPASAPRPVAQSAADASRPSRRPRRAFDISGSGRK